jgi:hypothetical protein
MHNDQFMPLLARPTAAGSSAAQFHLHGSASAQEAGAAADAAHGHAGQPVVTLLREGDRVTRIRIHCACGQEIELDCVY